MIECAVILWVNCFISRLDFKLAVGVAGIGGARKRLHWQCTELAATQRMNITASS